MQTPFPIPAAQTLLSDLLGNDAIKINIKCSSAPSVFTGASFSPDPDEASELAVCETENGFDCTVNCSGPKSAFYALCEMDRRLKENALLPGKYTVKPSFSLRGYIEGFYGRPWTQAQRVSVMETMAKYRMNAYFYAPKDDPYLRERWKELYNEDQITKLKNLAEYAACLYMDLWWCISPGLSVRYADANDFESLCEKTKQVYSIGVRRFGLLLDDIDDTLKDENDKAAYGTLANAHIDFINRYYNALLAIDPSVKLAVCPTLYHGKGDESYISEVAQNIPNEISLFWTGPDICSRTLTITDAGFFQSHTGHKPLYWDNYPVNDEAMFREMHLGPVIGRDPALFRHAEGLISNCMEYAECSKIPLCTVADYLWDSENYDPERSFANAVNEIAGEKDAEAFLTFADHLYTSCLLNENDRRLLQALYGAGKAVKENRPQDAAAIAESYKAKMNESLAFLSKDNPLCRELQPWIAKYKTACGIIDRLFEYILTPAHDEMRKDIEALIDIYASDPTVLIHEFVFREILLDRYLF